jgi:hypothetical protein
VTAAAVAIVVSLFVVGTVFVHMTIATLQGIIREVNNQIPENRQKFRPFGLRANLEVFAVLRAHRGYFPASIKRRRVWTLTAAYFVAFLAAFFVVVLNSLLSQQ